MITAIGGGIVGAAIAVAAPTIVSGIVGVLRPVAKEIVKGGIVVCNTVSDMASEVGEHCNDLVAEAKSEAQGGEVKPSRPAQSTKG